MLAGSWADLRRQPGRRQRQHVPADPPAQSFFIEISGGLLLSAPGVDEPLVDLSANVTLEIDTARKVFTLTFDGQLKLIKLGTVGATSGRFVLDMGDGTSAPPSSGASPPWRRTSRRWSSTACTCSAKGTLQINTTSDARPRR